MRVLKKVITAWIMTGMLLIPAVIHAQTTGNVAGRVTDSDSGESLPSANIRISGTNIGTTTDKEGRFRLHNVPTGRQSVVATCIGYTSANATIDVKSGDTVRIEIEMDSELLEGGEIVVKGTREGQARALTKQKNSVNVSNVISEELIERFPDPNAAEAIQRIPAVSVQRDQGEGRYVLIRGMSARLNSVAINGERLPSPEGEIRSVALDVIPADLISSIEVNKALTPDMDADAIGGSVNLITRSARDYSSRLLKGKLSGGYNNLMEDGNYQGAFTYGDRFGPDKKLGLILSANYYKTNRGSDNNEFSYGEEEINGVDTPITEELELRDYEVTRVRTGVSGTLDYSFNDDSMIFFRGIYNFFDDNEHRRRFGYRPDKGDYTSQYSSEDALVYRDLKDRYEAQRIMSFAAGGEHLLSNFHNLNVDYQLTYSYAEEEEPDRRDVAFEMEGVDLAWNKASDFPKFSVTNDADIYDYSGYEFDELVYEDNLTTEKDIIGAVNFELPTNLMDMPFNVKFGGKVRNKSKDRENDVQVYDWEGDEDLTLDQVVGSFEDDKFLNDKYKIGKGPDPDKVEKLFDNNKGGAFELDEEKSKIETDPANYDATETIAAVYGQGTLNVGKFTVLGGLRIENTDIDYTGYRVEVDEEGDYVSTKKVSDTNDYMNVFPMIHVKYELNDDTNIRGAVTTSIARPNYYSLVPYEFVNREDEELEMGNPELDPTRAVGFDLMVEHYFRPLGIVSGGFFYKSLEDFIFQKQTKIDGGSYDGYEIIRDENGDSASLYGVEVNWMHQLTFLPGHLNGLGIYANYTYTDSDADIPVDVGETRSATLPGQSESMGNLALSYEKFGFSGRISMNFHGSYIDEVGETSAEDEYYDDHTQVDINLSQKITDRVSLFADFINITDEPMRYYINKSSRPRQQEYYSFWSHFGVKFEL